MTKDDGGPAFPTQQKTGIAFAGDDRLLHAETLAQGGMSLRDWFAGQALASLGGDINPHLPGSSASGVWPDPEELAARRAKWAYLQADALLAARKETPND